MNKTVHILSLVSALVLLGVSVFAQTTPKPPPPIVVRDRAAAVQYLAGNYERSIEVVPSVSISMCVQRGDVKVNAWQRNEIRVMVDSGTNFGYKVMQKNVSSGIAEWVMIVRAAAERENPAAINECLSGGDIEIDAPTGASIRMKGDNVTFTVDGIRKVSLSNAGGDLTVRNAADGVLANTFRGDIFIESSRGGISADSATGNVVVFESSPADVGDTFRAKTTSGTISLDRITHRALEAHSISGSINYKGDLLPSADYYFTTMTGALRLFLPEQTSAKFQATYSHGKFDCGIPFRVETENVSAGSVKQIAGRMGDGQASLRLTTNTGGIIIRRQ